MEPKDSAPYSQEFATCSCPKWIHLTPSIFSEYFEF